MRRRALTLVEILVSLAIFSFVGLAVYALLRTGIFTRRKIISISSSVGDYYADLENMSRQLRNVFIFREAEDGFSGDDKNIHFFSLYFDYKEELPVVKRIGYSFVEGKFMKEEYSPLEDRKSKEFVFIKDILDVNFYYLGRDNEWINQWPPEAEEADEDRGFDEGLPEDIGPPEGEGPSLGQDSGQDEESSDGEDSSGEGKEVLPRAVRIELKFKIKNKNITFNKYVLLHKE